MVNANAQTAVCYCKGEGCRTEAEVTSAQKDGKPIVAFSCRHKCSTSGPQLSRTVTPVANSCPTSLCKNNLVKQSCQTSLANCFHEEISRDKYMH